MLATAGCRAFLILSLIVAFTVNAGAQLLPAIDASPLPVIGGPSLPVIVQISPGANITSIASTLGVTVIDSIPGTNIYLLNVPIGPLFNPATVQSLRGHFTWHRLVGIEYWCIAAEFCRIRHRRRTSHPSRRLVQESTRMATNRSSTSAEVFNR